MTCPRCRSGNDPDASFCTACGARLERACPKCQTANAADARFCKRCGQAIEAPIAPAAAPAAAPPAAAAPAFASPLGYTPRHLAEKILTSKSALEGERKQVTVLFADVSGFTTLSERLDPEDVHRIMTRAFELMLAEVHRYEGTVNQFLGDGIMALFGAPIAHEDHAQRAIHAALGILKALDDYQEELRRTRGLGLQVRQGLNTGLVVVGSIGSDLRMDYTAVGDTTNVAARLQQTADPGRIVISEATHRLAGAYFHTRALGELTLKGKVEPVAAWEVVSARVARTRLDVEVERGLTPYVGRERELLLLAERFEQAKGGQGQVVFVVGEPGIGKSRLLLEFRRRLGDHATWVEGRSMSFGRAIAFHPLIDLLRRTFRIEEADQEEAIIRKVEHAVLRLGEDLRPTLPWLRYLLSVDPGDSAVLAVDPQLRRAEVFGAIRRLLLRAAEVRPQIVVYEDVHWMDQATEEYVGLMADSIARSRVLMILSYRPGYTHPFGDRMYHTRIALTTLSGEDSVEMARAMLATERLPEELASLIVRKAEGNPFFVEEVVKSLQEVGAIRRSGNRYVLARRLDEIIVPDTIQDVIMARIDRLEDSSKKTLQLASVIGREFTRRLLDRIADLHGRTEDFLRELKAIELIYEKQLFPELAYMFKHALTHDVAYNSLLVQRRKDLHRLIGLAIEELYADRLAEQYEVIGYHFAKAEEWEKAFGYLMKAGEKAAQASATREALALYDQALEAAGHLGHAVDARNLMAVHQARADLHFLRSDFARARAEGERVVALAREIGDRATEAAALAGMGFSALFSHDFARALDESGQAIELAESVDAKPVVAAGALTVGMVHAVTARFDEARAEFTRVHTISRSVGDAVHHAFVLCLLGQLRNWAGEYDQALSLESEGLRIAREHNLVIPFLFSGFAYGLALTGKGDYDRALSTLGEGLALSEKVGDEIWRHRFFNCLGWVHLELGDLDRGLDLNRRCAEDAKKRGDHETIANAEINVGDAFLAKGDLVLAGELLDRVHGLVKDPATSDWMKWRYSTHLFASLGDLWLARGDPARAREFADRCLESATRTNAPKNRVKGWRLAGEIALARRQWDDAEAALRQALAIAETIGNPTQLWKTHLALGRLHDATGKREAARQAFQAARVVIDRVKAGLGDLTLRASLDTHPLIRAVADRIAPD